MKSRNNILIYLMIASTIQLGCVNGSNLIPGEDLANKVSTGVKKIEIYCWCFSNANGKYNKDDGITTSDSVMMCLTLMAVTPNSLINPKNLIDTITDPHQIERMTNAIVKQTVSVENYPAHIDTRFVMVLRKANKTADTLALRNNFYNTLIYNGKLQLNYSFGILDSIQAIRNKGTFFCENN